MNCSEFKDPLCYLCLNGSVVSSSSSFTNSVDSTEFNMKQKENTKTSCYRNSDHKCRAVKLPQGIIQLFSVRSLLYLTIHILCMVNRAFFLGFTTLLKMQNSALWMLKWRTKLDCSINSSINYFLTDLA